LVDKRSKIRFGIVGTSNIAKIFLEAAYLLEQFEFVAIYSRDSERGKAFVNGLGNIRIYECLEDLAAAKDIDAVYIASPTCCHASQSILLTESGKHVLCEKPICTNLYEWSKMLQSSSENNVIVLEAMRPLFTPGYEVIQRNLEKIGQIRKVNFSYCQYSSRYDKFKNGIVENAFKPELSNGALMDIGVYCVGVLVGLFGKPEHIFAHGYTLPHSIDAMGSLTAIYAGMQADLVYSKITDSELPCEIQGEKGTIYFRHISAPQEIRIKYRDSSEELLVENTNPNSMLHEVEVFLNMIHGSNAPEEYNDITSLAMEVIDEARKQIGIIYPADSLPN